jgi:hypothetical protein
VPPIHRYILVGACAAAVTLVGCSTPLPLDPAPHAADPHCASVMLAMPDIIGGLARRGTTAQATDAWGSDHPVVAKCGVDVPGPTTDTCVTIQTAGYSVDWVVHDGTDSWIATTYGRNPAVEILVPKAVHADSAIEDILSELTPPASLAATTGRACVGLGDVGGISPSP